MQIILFDNHIRNRFFPFAHTRPLADILCGIFTMRQRWEHLFSDVTFTLTDEFLRQVYPLPSSISEEYLYINAAVFGTPEIKDAINHLPKHSFLVKGKTIIAHKSNTLIEENIFFNTINDNQHLIEFENEIVQLENIWDIFKLNEQAIQLDFEAITTNRQSAALPDYVTAINAKNIFVEEGAILSPCILNATHGYIYIAKDAEVMDGVMVRGSLALNEHAVLKMGAKIYGATTIGSGSKVGGEVNNAVFFANSNKGHDGFIGNAVIGEWCNLGADTNCSNLKNNYDEIKIWNEYEGKSVKSGLQFCGLLMGDHSKCGINTMFNTGTVVGVSCNIYGAGFPDKFIPSFTWGSKDEMLTYKIDKALDTANRMMQRRDKKLSTSETELLIHIFNKTQYQRDLLHYR